MYSSFIMRSALLVAIVLACGTEAAQAVSADSYESDDSFATASTIRIGVSQDRTWHTFGDLDYVKFDVRTTSDVVISATSTFGYPTMTLYGSSNVDPSSSTYPFISSSFNNQITKTLPLGTYYLMVDDLLNGIATYSLSVDATPISSSNNAFVTSLVPGNKEIEAHWTSVTLASSYYLYYGTTSGNYTNWIYISNPATTSYTITGLTNNTVYFVAIKADVSSVLSDYSNEQYATPNIDAPTGVAATPGDHTATISWNSVIDATVYDVYSASDIIGPYLIVAPDIVGTSTTIAGLTNFETRYYAVKARNLTSESLFSAVVTCIPVGPPEASTGITAAPWDAEVTVSWDTTANADSYDVYYSTSPADPSPTLAGNTTSTSLTVGGLTNETAYYFVVVAKNIYGSSADSAEVSATPYLPLAAPANVATVAGDKLITISWDAVAGASAYLVEYSENSGAPYEPTYIATEGNSPVSTSLITLTLNNLPNFHTFYLRVTALDASARPGYNSSEVSDMPVGPSLPPAYVVTYPYDGTITISWTGSLGAASYNVYYSEFPGAPYNPVNIANEGAPPLNTAATAITLTGLQNDVPVYLAVSAVNIYGEGSLSIETTATPRAALTFLGGGCMAGNGFDHAYISMLLPVFMLWLIAHRRKTARL